MRRSPPVRMTRFGIPDDEARHARAQRLRRHVFGAHAPGGDGHGDFAGGRRNLFTAAVAERQGQRHLAVVRRVAAEGIEHGADDARKRPRLPTAWSRMPLSSSSSRSIMKNSRSSSIKASTSSSGRAQFCSLKA